MKIGVNWKNLLGILVFVASQQAVADYKVITDRKPMGKHGWIYSWNIYSDRGAPKSIGVSITGAALKALPDEMEVIVLQPKEKHRIRPYRHITVDWNPHGHDPMGIYTTPHFDFHFFFLTSAQREAITCQGADALVCMKVVPAKLIPPYYGQTPEGVPKMGWHWVDLTSPEFNGQPFTSTFIYGYYNGQTAFLEPMVTLDFLNTKPHVTFPVKQATGISEEGYYPKNYSVHFNHVTDTYDVALIDLQGRTTSR